MHLFQVLKVKLKYLRKQKELFLLLFLCLIWFGVAAGSNNIGKIILTEFPYPITLTTNHHLNITIYSFPLLYILRARFKHGRTQISKAIYLKYILPMTILKVLTEASGLFSVWKPASLMLRPVGRIQSHFYK